MFKTHEEVFIAAGYRAEAKDALQGSIYLVKLQIGDRTEVVEPKENGFLTGPNSKLSPLFNKQGCTLIPADCGRFYADRKRRYRSFRDNTQTKQWLAKSGAAQGGILYGEIAPGKKRGWYAVLMMKVGRLGGYIDYLEPGYQFLGEHTLCEQIRKERGVDGIYNNGCEFFVTTVTGQEDRELCFPLDRN